MAISHKGRAKLHRDGRLFLWWVADVAESHWCGHILNVYSEDKHFRIGYPIRQGSDLSKEPFVWVWGDEFPGLPDAGGCWIKIQCPRWDDVQITPSFVRRLLDWCMAEKTIIRIEWNSVTNHSASY